MTTVATRLDPPSTSGLRLPPSIAALMLFGLLLLAPALAGVEGPSREGEQWRGNSAALPAR